MSADVPPLRVGVVGLGLIGQSVHLPNLLTLRDDFCITHVCDVSLKLAETIADGLPGKVAASDDWHRLVADPDVDAVLVLTPGSHGDVALAALEAGKHVLAEKPLAYSRAEVTELHEAATESGRVLQVAYMKAHDPVLQRARDELTRIGDLRVVRVTVLHPSHEVQFAHWNLHPPIDPHSELISRAVHYSTERAREALGDAPAGVSSLYTGILLGSVVHELALVRALGLGDADSIDLVTVEPTLTSEPAAEPPRILAIGRLPNGVRLEISWNWLPDFPEYTEEVAVFGSAGRVFLSMPGPYLPAHRAQLRVQRMQGGERSDTTWQSSHTTAFVEELKAFARSVREGAPVTTGAIEALRDTEVLQRMALLAATEAGLVVSGEAATAR